MKLTNKNICLLLPLALGLPFLAGMVILPLIAEITSYTYGTKHLVISTSVLIAVPASLYLACRLSWRNWIKALILISLSPVCLLYLFWLLAAPGKPHCASWGDDAVNTPTPVVPCE